MKKEIENIRKKLILGMSGKYVNCMLLDSKEEIKASNPHLTDKEVDAALEMLQMNIESIQDQYTEEFRVSSE